MGFNEDNILLDIRSARTSTANSNADMVMGKTIITISYRSMDREKSNQAGFRRFEEGLLTAPWLNHGRSWGK
jgi:hypothetical protein